MEDVAPVYWMNTLVGHISNIEQDMWYLEGDWIANQDTDLQKFSNLLQTLEPLNALTLSKNQQKMLWIGIFHNRPTHIVLSLAENRLFTRMMTNPPETWGSI